MAPGESGGGAPAETRAQAQAGIRGWVTHNEAKLRHMAPQAILTGMTAAAFAPILVPMMTTSVDSAAVQAALLTQFGGAGAGYLAAAVQQFADRQGERAEPPAITEEKLRELLREAFEGDLSGASSAKTRQTISDLVLGVNGVEALLQAAAESDEAGLLSHLVRALSADRSFLSTALGMLDSLRRIFSDIQSSQRDADELPSRVLLEIRLLRHELTRRSPVVADLTPAADSSHLAGPRPYPGLAPFEERDAAWFFGRDDLIVKLVNALDKRVYGNTPLVVAGVSGAGKSAVLRAGLIPALEAGGLTEPGSADWPVRAMRPDRHPLEQLSLHLGELAGGLICSDVHEQLMVDPARAPMIVRQGLLSREGRQRRGIMPTGNDPIRGIGGGSDAGQRRLILVVDQFEEVFTRCHDEEERRVFIDALCAIASGSRDEPPTGLVVIGLQIAFEEQCTAHPGLRPALARPVNVDTMTADEFREAIELPASLAGLTVQAGLVPTMLGDLGAVESRTTAGQLTYDPGRLPLLAHALLETWKARDGQELTIAAYQKAGGVRDALANTADGLLGSLNESERQALRRLLVYHLIAAVDFSEDARRHISREALLKELLPEDRKRADLLLDRLTNARLLTVDAGGMQIAHEALLRHWPALADWLAAERDWRRETQRVLEQARTWDAEGRDADLLPRGIALAIIEDKIAGARVAGLGELGELAREFLDVARRQAARARHRKRTRIAGLAAAIATVVIAVITVLQVHAAENRNLALAESRATTSQLIEAAQHANDPVLSLLLDVEAYRVGGATADNGLLSAQADFFTSTLTNPAGAGSAVAFDSAAPLLAIAGHDAITVFRVTPHQRALTLRGGSPFYAVAFSPAGTLLAGAEQDGVTIVWDVQTWKPVVVLGSANGLSVNAVAFQPHGGLIATAGISGVVTVWNLHGRHVSVLQAGTPQNGVTINGLAFSPDGTRLAAACSDRTVRLWGMRGKPKPVMLTGHSAPVRAVAFGPDSNLLASADDDGAIRVWNAKTGAPLGSLPGGGTQPVDALAFSPKGTLLASGGVDGVVRLWDINTRAQISALTGPSSRVTGLAFSHNGQTIASVEADPTVGLWNVTTPPQPETSSIAAVATGAGARMPIATIGSGTAMGLWNPISAASYASAALPTPLAVSAAPLGDIPPSLALSPDGTVVAVPLASREVGLWSIASGRRIASTPPASQPLTSVAYSPAADDPILAAGGSYGTVYLWPPGASQPISVNGELASGITSIAFSPHGAMLAAGSSDGTFLLVKRAPSGQWTPFTPPTLPLDAINTVAFSADGTLLATGSVSGIVRLWNISDPANPIKVASLTGPAGPVISVAFSEDGMLAASSDDDSIRVWNTKNPAAPTPVATLTGLATPTSVAWEPGKQTLVGAAPDGTLLTWDTDPRDVANRICHALASHSAEVAAIVPSSGYPSVCP